MIAVAGLGRTELYWIGVAVALPAMLMLAAGRLASARSLALAFAATGALALVSVYQVLRWGAAFPALYTALAVADGVSLATLGIRVEGRRRAAVAIIGRVVVAIAFVTLAAFVLVSVHHVPDP
jgi:hypothetical protein